MTADELREARDALAATVERFARAEIAPHVTAWDAAGEFPRALYRRAADLGLLGLGYPEAYGGTPAPHALRLPMWVALCRYGASGGVLASLLSHNIGLPPVLALGSEDVKREVIPPVLAGARIGALAITEPGGGSDVAALRTTARRDGDDYVVDGEKIFITSGMRADWITVAVRTGDGRGAKDISLLLVPGDSQGLSRMRLDKMGWLCSDTPRTCASMACACRRATCWATRAQASRPSWAISTPSAVASPAPRWAFPWPATTRRWPGRSSARPSAAHWSATRWCATSSSTCSSASDPQRPGWSRWPRAPTRATSGPIGSVKSAC